MYFEQVGELCLFVLLGLDEFVKNLKMFSILFILTW